MNMRNKKQEGYLLIEAMVAMGILTTSVLGIFALMSQSIKLTRVVDDQYVGTYLAAEGIEITKNLLDTNILTDVTKWNVEAGGDFSVGGCYEVDITSSVLPGAGCPSTLLKLKDSLYSYDPTGSASGFSRSVNITPIIDGVGTQEGIHVVSTVTWAGGGSSVTVEDKFYNWH
jgi:Tfp pilus assembly protein PilV